MQDVLRPDRAPSAKATRLMGRFRCEALLQGEGLLETWRARVQGLAGFDRMFAVKCLVAGALTRRPRAAEDLLRSARAVTSLKDGRIANVMDSGLAPGSAFVATEFIHGISLRSLREYVHGRAAEEGGRPLSWPSVVLHVCAEIAGALAAAHASNPPLAHGALSAGSVMVTPQGGIKLIDLGLFAAVHTPAEIAASPVRRPCAAPELGRGEAPTPPSDLYALGALALELATGRERQATGKLESGASWARVLAPELQTLVRQLLSFDKNERPSAQKVEAGLREALAQVRGLDMRGELGQLVRRVMQSTGAQPAAVEEAAPSGGAHDAGPESPFHAEPADHTFGDEPTQVLVVSDDGQPTKLAGILRDIRLEVEEAEGTRVDGRISHITPMFATPATGTPIYRGTTDEDVPGHPDAGGVVARGEARENQLSQPMGAPVATLVVGAPMSELPDITTAEVAGRLGNGPGDVLKAARPISVPRVVPFAEFSAGVPSPAQMTPAGWRPTGDLDGPTETDTVPLTEEPARQAPDAEPTGRRMARMPRVLLVLGAAAVLGAGLAAAVRFAADRPPAAVPEGAPIRSR